MQYARKLRKGDKVAIVSLSSGMLGEEFCSHNIEIGVKRLTEYGLEPVFMPNALKGYSVYKISTPSLVGSTSGENKVMELSPIISCCVAIGDKRKFISLLVCIRCKLDEEGESTHQLAHDVVTYLEGLGSSAKTIEEAMKDEHVAAHINSVVEQYNKVAVSRAQEIRKWCILPEEFTVGKGELTATMKLRRAVVQEHYAKEIDSMYTESQ